VIAPREEKHIYSVSYHNDQFYILSNRKAPNFKLLTAVPTTPSEKNWKVLIDENPKAMLSGFVKMQNHLVIQERGDAKYSVKVIDLKTSESHYIKMKEDNSMVSISSQPTKNSDTLRISYSSLAETSRVFEYNMNTKDMNKIWEDSLYITIGQVVKRYVNGRKYYTTERVWATANDGTKIPITLVYQKYKRKSGLKYLWLTSYASYGSGQDLRFPKAIYPLLERGFVYAVAHVRGGDDMGWNWYEEGKMFNKMNTFTDFTACAERLIEKGYTEKGKIVAQGGSAGGLLMGAVANMRPDLFHSIILDVPFVDVINTMLDDKLPLTTGEYEEWGNPNVKKEFNYIRKYSPYENVKSQAYPNMLFFTGLNDQRVGYWEPAKMVAKLRQYNTSDNLVLLKTNLTAGHGGGSGRYSFLSDISYKFAIILDMIRTEEEIKKTVE
jgi:protease II